MVTYHGIQCSIHAASAKLDEYEDPTNSGTMSATENGTDVITRYIDIDKAEGKNFTIEVDFSPEFKWDKNDPSARVACSSSLDGQRTTPAWCLSSDIATLSISGPIAFVQKVNGRCIDFVEEMYFSPVNIVRSQQATNKNPQDLELESLGKIKVEFWKVVSRGAIPPLEYSREAGTRENDNTLIVHKNAIKGKGTSHRVCFKEPKADAETRRLSVDWDTAKLLVTFIFLYRTHSYLDNMGIIPYVPFHSEITTTTSGNAFDMDEDE